MPTFADNFTSRYYEIISRNEDLRRQVGVGARRPVYVPPRIISSIPSNIPINTRIALATFNPLTYGGDLVQQYPQNFQIIQSAAAKRIEQDSQITSASLQNFIPGAQFPTSAVQRRPGTFGNRITGYSPRRAIIAGLDPRTREIVRKLEDLQFLRNMIDRFQNYASRLESIIAAAARVLMANISKFFLLQEREILQLQQELVIHERRYRLAKKMVQLLIRAARAIATALMKLFTKGNTIWSTIVKSWQALTKVLSVFREIFGILFGRIKRPRKPRLRITKAAIRAYIINIWTRIKTRYSVVFKRAYQNAINRAGQFDITDEKDIVLRAFSESRKALQTASNLLESTRKTAEQTVLDVETKLRNNINSTVQNVLNEQQRILQRYENLKLSGSAVENAAEIRVGDATIALRGTAGFGLDIAETYNQLLREFPKLAEANNLNAINPNFVSRFRTILNEVDSRLDSNPVTAQAQQTGVLSIGDIIETSEKRDNRSQAIQLANRKNRDEAYRQGYSAAKTFTQQELQVSEDGVKKFIITVRARWVFHIWVNGQIVEFDSNSILSQAAVNKITQDLANIANASVTTTTNYPPKVLEVYEKSKEALARGAQSPIAQNEEILSLLSQRTGLSRDDLSRLSEAELTQLYLTSISSTSSTSSTPSTASTIPTYPGKIYGMLAPDTSRNDNNIKLIQGKLNSVLNLTLETNTGIFGPRTEDAVKEFQRRWNTTYRGTRPTLTVDGRVGRNTWDALFSMTTTTTAASPTGITSTPPTTTTSSTTGTTTPPIYRVNASSGVRIRRNPTTANTQTNSIEILNNNTNLELLNVPFVNADGYTWAKFKVKDRVVEGWIATSFVQPSPIPITTPPTTTTPPPSPPIGPPTGDEPITSTSISTTTSTTPVSAIPPYPGKIFGKNPPYTSRNDPGIPQIQLKLNSVLNLNLETTSGVYGTQTENAVRSFQRRWNENTYGVRPPSSPSLAVDGLVGTNTWNALFSVATTQSTTVTPTSSPPPPPPPPPSPATTSSTSRKIVFIGDSLAVGTSAYVVRQQNSVVRNVVLGNSALGGPTFLQVAGSSIETARVGANTRQIIQFANNPNVQLADIAIISAGSNDIPLSDGRIDRVPLNTLRSTLRARRYIWIVPIISKARDIVKSVAGQNGDRIVEYTGTPDSAGVHPSDGYRSFGNQIITLLGSS